MSKERSPEVDTALHILKGAIVKVLNTPLTTSIQSKKNEGRISVEYNETKKPSDEVLKQIEDLANRKIKENLEVSVTKMNRNEAEKKFKENLVNNTFIYDKVAVPSKITEVNILLIPDWNVNCCGGTHVKSTGQVGLIKVLRTNLRETKKELEFVFEVHPPINNENNNPEQVFRRTEKTYNDVNDVTDKIIYEIFSELKVQKIDLSGKEELISLRVKPRIAQSINILKIHTYTDGYSAHKLERKSMIE